MTFIILVLRDTTMKVVNTGKKALIVLAPAAHGLKIPGCEEIRHQGGGAGNHSISGKVSHSRFLEHIGVDEKTTGIRCRRLLEDPGSSIRHDLWRT